MREREREGIVEGDEQSGSATSATQMPSVQAMATKALASGREKGREQVTRPGRWAGRAFGIALRGALFIFLTTKTCGDDDEQGGVGDVVGRERDTHLAEEHDRVGIM